MGESDAYRSIPACGQSNERFVRSPFHRMPFPARLTVGKWHVTEPVAIVTMGQEMTMADTDLYDSDILAWSEQQAKALRSLAGRRDLPNALDLSHVVEEIEDVGLNQLHAATSFIGLILTHAIKCWADPDAQSLLHWHAEIGNWQTELVRRLTASMHSKIDLDREWRRAVRQAVLDLKAQGADAALIPVRLVLDTACPLSLDDLGQDPADPALLVERLTRMLPSQSR
jgi:hypothetical protein